MISRTLIKTTFSAYIFSFFSISASDVSDVTTAGQVVSPRYIMVHHGFLCREVSGARKEKSVKQTKSRSSLLVAVQVDVNSKLN